MSRCISSSETPLDRRSQWPTPRSRFLGAWTISRLNRWQIRLVICLARSRALQATQDLEYLHLESICHGDLNYSNVLFQLANFDSWSKHELQALRGNPRLSHINCGPGRPRYLVDSHLSLPLSLDYWQRTLPLPTTVNLSSSNLLFSWTPHILPLHCPRSFIWVGRELSFRYMGTRLLHIWDARWLLLISDRYKKSASWSCRATCRAALKVSFILESFLIQWGRLSGTRRMKLGRACSLKARHTRCMDRLIVLSMNSSVLLMSTLHWRGPSPQERLGRCYPHKMLTVAKPILSSIGNPHVFISLGVLLPNGRSKRRLKKVWRLPGLGGRVHQLG